MKMTKVPFDSKYRKILAEAHDYVREVKEFRARQRALGLLDESDDESATRAKGPLRPSYVSDETEKALGEAKKKLNAILRKSKGAGQLNEVWLRMMVDYWESKKLMEQTYGEYHA